MSISQALSSANTGLGAAARRAAVVSSNVANASTPGYARREVTVGERVLDGRGAGVQVTGVNRAGDPAITAARRLAGGESSRDNALAAVEAQLAATLGGPEDPYSLFAAIENLEGAMFSLRETPESVAEQQSVLDAANQLTDRFQQISTENRRIRVDADAEISRQVDEVNTALRQVESINQEIRRAVATGRDTAALEDQRQRLVDQVSQLVPIREIPRGGGEVDLITNEGVFLLSGAARTLEFTPTPTVTDGATLENGGLSGLYVDGVDITPGSDASLAPRGGEIAANFAVRDEIAPQFSAEIDALAADLITRFSDPATDASLDGVAPGLFTDAGAALAVDPAPGVASRIAVNDRVDPANGGALWRLRDGVGADVQGPIANGENVTLMIDGLRAPRAFGAGGLTGEMSAIDAAADFVSLRNAAAFAAEGRAATSAARTQGLLEAEQEASAVDTDAELQALLRIEQAYAANARVISAVDEMLSRLLEL